MINWNQFKDTYKEYITFCERRGFLYYVYRTATDYFMVAVKENQVTILN